MDHLQFSYLDPNKPIRQHLLVWINQNSIYVERTDNSSIATTYRGFFTKQMVSPGLNCSEIMPKQRFTKTSSVSIAKMLKKYWLHKCLLRQQNWNKSLQWCAASNKGPFQRAGIIL